MTVLPVEFKTKEQLTTERDELLCSIGLTMDELNARLEDGTVSVEEYGVSEAIADIDYLLG